MVGTTRRGLQNTIKPKQTFRLTQNTLLWKIFYLMNFLMNKWSMPSDKHNVIITKAMGLIFLLFDIASAWEVPFGHTTVDLLVSSLVFHSSLLTAKSANLAVAHDDFLCVKEIVCVFHSGYFDYRSAFDSCCCVTESLMDTLLFRR